MAAAEAGLKQANEELQAKLARRVSSLHLALVRALLPYLYTVGARPGHRGVNMSMPAC